MEMSQTKSRWLIVAWYNVVYQSRYSTQMGIPGFQIVERGGKLIEVETKNEWPLGFSSFLFSASQVRLTRSPLSERL